MFPKPSKTNRADASLPCVPCNRTSGKWRVSSAPVLQTAVADVRTYKVKWSIICETKPCSFSLWPQPWIYPADYHNLSAETCLVSQTRSKSAGSNLPTSSSLPCAPCNRACRKRDDPLHRLIFICRPTIQKQTQQPSIASATCNSKAAEQLIIFLSYTTSICLSSLK